MDFDRVNEERWSPRDFTSEEIDASILSELFEAIHWAQSSFNEQPWRYLVATKDDGSARERLENCLLDGNAFAKEAWILGISFAKSTFTRNGNPNRVAQHDLGAANQVLALKAWELGLNTRFMAGFHVEKAAAAASSDFEPVAMFVIGKATPEALSQGAGERGRRPFAEYVFRSEWDQPFFK